MTPHFLKVSLHYCASIILAAETGINSYH